MGIVSAFTWIFCIMPKSHCAESTVERARINHSSLFGGSFLVILVHCGNDNDNDNQLEQCSSRACNFGRSFQNFEHVQKFHVPSANNFHSCLCALKMCSYHFYRTAYMLYSSHSYCILVVLTVY